MSKEITSRKALLFIVGFLAAIPYCMHWEASFPTKAECTPQNQNRYRFQLCVSRYYQRAPYPIVKDYLLEQGFVETTRPEDVPNNRFRYYWQSEENPRKDVNIMGQYAHPEGRLINFSAW